MGLMMPLIMMDRTKPQHQIQRRKLLRKKHAILLPGMKGTAL